MSDKKTILIIGKGFLGTYIENISYKFKVVGTRLKSEKNVISLDVRNFENVELVFKKINPDYVINCAANGQIDFLESHEELAMDVNANGALNVAEMCKLNHTRMVFISTDSVFDGNKGNYSEKDDTAPLNVYAKSKLKGEKNVEKTLKNYVIARTNFYGLNNNDSYFFNWILTNLKNQKTIKGFEDVIFSPLDVSTLSKMIIELLDKKFTGMIHLSSGISISKYDFIYKVSTHLGFSKDNIIRSKLTDIPNLAPRPKDTSLNNNLALETLETKPITLEKWIKQNKYIIMKYFN